MTDAQEAVGTVRDVIKAIIDSPDIIELQAIQAEKLMKEYQAHGFSRDEAIKLICATLQKGS